MINAIQANTIDTKKIGDDSSTLAEAAFEAGEKMGIPRVLDVDESYDEKSLLLYLSYFYNVTKKSKNYIIIMHFLLIRYILEI